MENLVEVNLQKNEEFFLDITGWSKFGGGFLEAVTGYTKASYFSQDQIPELIQYANENAKAGIEVHYGPAVRENDLGNKRSNSENILWSSCFWVDIDAPDKTISAEDQIKAAKKLLDAFIINLESYGIEASYIVGSGHGYHLYFIIKRLHYPPGEDWSAIQNALIELADGDRQAKDSTRLLRVPDTRNYKDRNNPADVKIISASRKKYVEADFKQIVTDYAPKVTYPVKSSQSVAGPLGFIPPCIEYLLNPGNKPQKGYRHQVRQVLSTYLFKEGVSEQEAVQKLMHTTDDPKKAEADVHGIYRALKLDPGRYSNGCKDGSSLRSLVDSGVTVCDKDNCQFGKPKVSKAAEGSEDKKTIPSAWFPGLIDLVLDDDGEVAYLMFENGNLVLKKEIPSSKGTLVPPPIDKIIWLIPKYTEVLRHFNSDNDIQLFEDLVAHFYKISELPTENHYRLNALWAMHTYLFDKSSYSPILWYYAIAGRGKSRTGMGLIHVAWRGVHVITVAEAHIIRLAEHQRATIFFDCTDLGKKIQKAGSDDIFLCRFEKGVKIARVNYPERGAFYDTEFFEVYGPTVIATNEPVNSILETRSIQTIMPESNRIFNDDVKAEHGLPIRERLVAFRARHLNQNLPDVDKPIKGRLGDIMRPLLQALKLFSDQDKWFFEILYDFEQNLKEDISESKEAQIVRVIYELRNQARNEKLSNEKILDTLNQDRPERFHMTAKSLGWKTKSLNFKKYADGKQRGIYWDEHLVAMLCGRYGIDYKQDTGPLTI